jgi:hypothetical protein
MVQVRLDFISGASYPVSVFIADVYGNNQSLLGTINAGPVPPEIAYNSVIPPIFQTAPQIMLILRDSAGCEIFKILDCTFGCAFNITVSLVDCIVNISIQESSCVISGISVDAESCSVDLV